MILVHGENCKLVHFIGALKQTYPFPRASERPAQSKFLAILMNAHIVIFVVACLICALAPVHAQSTISPTDRHAYAANAGWLDLFPSSGNGVVVTDTYLRGKAYAANFGWISLSSGVPGNGHTFSNSSATDYGVNLAADGKLIGYAYAANIGWINFEQTHGQSKIDLATGKFSGHAYSANIGWIALDTAFSELVTLSINRPDSDGDGLANGWELKHFSNHTTANATTDHDGDGCTDLEEYGAGTNPLDANSNLRITAHSYNTALTEATITFTTVATRRYKLEYSADLTNWTNSTLGTFGPAPTPTTTSILTALPTPAPQRFFRVQAVALP